MKLFYTIIIAIGFSFAATAQESGLEIHLYGDATDISGTVHEYTSGGYIQEVKFGLKNVSGTDMESLRLERVRITALAGTKDRLCWGLYCYDTGFVSASDPFVVPMTDDLTVYAHPDSTVLILAYHHTEDISGTAQYRYYVINGDGTRLDSIDAKFTSTVSILESEKVVISAYPNPVVDQLNILLEDESNKIGLELYNLVGETVLTTKLQDGKNIISTQHLPNGVYFYAILNEDKIVETKKIIIRH